MGNVLNFSHTLCVNSEEKDNEGEKQHPENIYRDGITHAEFESDLEVLSKTSLAKKYNPEYSSHRNSKNRANAKGYDFEYPVFKDFLGYMGPKPDSSHTLDRINNSEGYITGNMRWADKTTQNNNKSDNINLTVDGVTKTLGRWAAATQQSYSTLYNRYSKGWPHDWIVNGKPKHATKAPTFTKNHASEWAECRPTDLQPGKQWPWEGLVNKYELLAIPRGDNTVPTFSWYNHGRLPVCVWLAASTPTTPFQQKRGLSMPTKKAKTPKPKYHFINITLEKRTTRVNCGLSWRVRDKRSRNESLQVFSTPTHIELSGHCTYPEDRKDQAFNFDIYSGTEHEEQATRP